jgi:hypothetical protein
MGADSGGDRDLSWSQAGFVTLLQLPWPWKGLSWDTSHYRTQQPLQWFKASKQTLQLDSEGTQLRSASRYWNC